jgi:spore germination protein YaaH
VYVDQESVKEYKQLAAEYNLYGVAYWRLGNEENIIQN